MKNFEYEQAESFEEAAEALKGNRDGETAVMAGGTDLLGVWKDGLLKEYPKTVVSLKGIKDGSYIKQDGDEIEIGAMTKLIDVVDSDLLKKEAPILPQAAFAVATPIIRNVGTVGGNICQDVRCWFYRYPKSIGDIFYCSRKGGSECYAIRGDNRYHSIYGGMKTHANPCASECPANTDIPGYMAKVREGDMDGAAEIIMQYNPIPMITSRVCAHTCQTKCNRCTTDESVAIHIVERKVGDYILDHADHFYAKPARETGKKVALVGAGPAGLAAAYYLRKAGHQVTIYDRLEEAGGCLMYAIPAYRLPKHYVKDVVKAYQSMGVEFKQNTEAGKDISMEQLEKDFDKVFIATGAWKRPILGIDGEEFTEFGLQFLMEVNQWLNKKERNKVLVVGGGNVAMDVAVTCRRLGAKSVTLACLEQEYEMPASAEEVARAKGEGIEVMNGFGPLRVLYDGKKITGIELKTCVSVFDETGRFNPKYDKSKTVQVDCDSVMMATGQRVDLDFLGDKYLDMNRGRIKTDEETQKTSRSDVFAGGDAVTGPKTVIMAIHSGRVAAESINAELGEKNPPKYRPDKFIHFNEEGAQNTTAVRAKELPPEERALDKEDSLTISDEEAVKEASRCMNCGCYSVNASDLSPCLVALDADIITTKKTIRAEDFFTTKLRATDMLDGDELVKAIRFKVPASCRTGYSKFRVRKSIDFAIVSLAYCLKEENGVIRDARLVLGGVAPVPLRREEVEKLIVGQKPSKELAAEAGELAVKDVTPMKDNGYKVQEVRTLVKRLIEDLQ